MSSAYHLYNTDGITDIRICLNLLCLLTDVFSNAAASVTQLVHFVMYSQWKDRYEPPSTSAAHPSGVTSTVQRLIQAHERLSSKKNEGRAMKTYFLCPCIIYEWDKKLNVFGCS